MNNVVSTIVVTWLGTMLVMMILFIGLALNLENIKDKLDVATIGGTEVPAVHCAEDEVIWWTGIDTLGCVHYEEVN